MRVPFVRTAVCKNETRWGTLLDSMGAFSSRLTRFFFWSCKAKPTWEWGSQNAQGAEMFSPELSQIEISSQFP